MWLEPVNFLIQCSDYWGATLSCYHFQKDTGAHQPDPGRPLPDRRNIVVSGRPGLAPEGVEVAPTLEDAISLASSDDDRLPHSSHRYS